MCFSQDSEDTQKSASTEDAPPPVSLPGADASKHVGPIKLRRASSTDPESSFSTLVKAGCLLTNIKINVAFQHEEEQRQVLALAYDAFKCQKIFNISQSGSLCLVSLSNLHSYVCFNSIFTWFLNVDCVSQIFNQSIKSLLGSHAVGHHKIL